MEKLILKDGTELEVHTAGIGNITIEVEDYAALGNLSQKLSKENLEKIQYKEEEQTMGDYTDMAVCEPRFCITEKPTCLQVTFGLRKLTKEEKQQDDVNVAVTYLTDEQALTVKELYGQWEANVAYKTGDRRNYGENLYKCKQTHTSEAQHTPDLIPALWDIIYPENYGTIENPVIIPEEVSSMVYVKGRYYKEGETLYFMNREGMEDGEQISLTYKPSQLVGQYFEIIE